MTTREATAIPKQRKSADGPRDRAIAGRERTGPVRVDLRGARLLPKLAPGDVALVDLQDIDLDTATALAARRPAAVVNVAVSASGRGPGLGAAALVNSGVRLVDGAGPGVLAVLDDGDLVTVTAAGEVKRNGEVVASGHVQDESSLSRVMRPGPAGIVASVAAFGAAAPVVLESDGQVLLHVGVGTRPAQPAMPHVDAMLRTRGTKARARALARGPVLVVGGGPRAAADVAAVRRLLPRRPLVVATQTGADVVVAVRRRPDVVVGDVRRMSPAVLATNPVVVHLADPAAAQGDLDEARERMARSEVTGDVWRTCLDPAEAAQVLAAGAGAPLVVTAGTTRGLAEFADRAPTAMAGAALTGAALGHSVVPARALAAFRPRAMPWPVALAVLLVGAAALGLAVAALAGGVALPDPVAGAVSSAVDRIAELAGAAGDASGG